PAAGGRAPPPSGAAWRPCGSPRSAHACSVGRSCPFLRRTGARCDRCLSCDRCGDRPDVAPSVDRLLQRALRAELRRVLAWVLSGALVTAVTAAVSSPTAIAVGLVAALF